MPDVSPTKWHLAHTTWFFETFVVKVWLERYRSEVPQYAYLFNSYYNAAGDMHRRDLRGLISRPTVQETFRYRESIDDCVIELIEGADAALLAEIAPIVTLGIHHEQQHQELLVTDIKHVFAQNPLYPVFEKSAPAANEIEIGAGNILSSSMSKLSSSAMRAMAFPTTTKARNIAPSWERSRLPPGQ